ncbi:Metallo-dependent hydrolase [Glarea lozoyensis ATCC 20868]|uniref:Metallo-dependent hydrolase n=1 Tax=Glarea lozoyensis (strain ATCC 20868 / MF5171) TaxID=1116229 RepID=S3E971_GLAL2|nr:Metallo-dependent hydrolase [Glarea lozoyensis ATCC 20868]EPE34808.1 Metallo-dependent hydrolase [Glarea lozoyensis ATCC 20868]
MATESPIPEPPSSYKPRYIDIGINLTDPVYSGIYHGTQRHPADLHAVVARAKEAGCTKLIVTGSDLAESKKAVELAKEYPGTIYTTIGVHPCSCTQFETHDPSPEDLLSQLKKLAIEAKSSGHCVAFGEIGLDYDRLTLCPKKTQLKYFTAQLELATELQLPLFLHSRAAHADFLTILNKYSDRLPKRGVVHSFTGSMEEMQELVQRGWHIGVNGCSLKTEDNLKVVKEIPLERLMLETDGPWCEIRASHAGSKYLKGFEEVGRWVKKERWAEGNCVKGRNEPCVIGKVGVVVAGVRGVELREVTEMAWGNTGRVFGIEG